MSQGYDSRCAELAKYFLGDVQNQPSADHVGALAQELQDCIEAYIGYHFCENCGKPTGGKECSCAEDNRDTLANLGMREGDFR